MEQIIKNVQSRTLKIDMSDCNWGEGVALWGFNHSTKVFPNKDYIPFLEKWVKTGLENNKFQFTVNTSIPYVGMGEVYRYSGNEEYLRLMKCQADYLMNEAPRLANGAISLWSLTA